MIGKQPQCPSKMNNYYMVDESYPLWWFLLVVQQLFDFKLTLVFGRIYWWDATVDGRECRLCHTGRDSSTRSHLYKPHGMFLQIRMKEGLDNSQ